jgi:hypothetical protein
MALAGGSLTAPGHIMANGALLIAVGVLEVTGAWTTIITWLKLHAISSYTSPL